MLLSYGANHFYGYGMGGFGFFWDPTMIFALAGLVLSMLAAGAVRSTFAKYSRVRAMCGLTGAQAAERLLRSAGINDVRIEHIQGSLNDHYDPRTKVLRLSDSVYGSDSVAALGVAAHECGHAIQHQVHYGPLVLRSTLVPLANFGSTLAWPVFIIGLISSVSFLTTAGIILFGLAVLFQLVTLPVEFNASSRAVAGLGTMGILGQTETEGAKKVLRAAAMTYVASLAASILQLLRLLILARGRRND